MTTSWNAICPRGIEADPLPFGASGVESETIEAHGEPVGDLQLQPSPVQSLSGLAVEDGIGEETCGVWKFE